MLLKPPLNEPFLSYSVLSGNMAIWCKWLACRQEKVTIEERSSRSFNSPTHCLAYMVHLEYVDMVVDRNRFIILLSWALGQTTLFHVNRNNPRNPYMGLLLFGWWWRSHRDYDLTLTDATRVVNTLLLRQRHTRTTKFIVSHGNVDCEVFWDWNLYQDQTDRLIGLKHKSILIFELVWGI